MEDQKLDAKQLVADAVAKFREEHAAKSFSDRHPELGKMINCPVCLRRHRSVIKCEQVFTTGTHDPAPEGEKMLLVAAQTRKGILGAALFAKKRIFQHHSKRLLQLVQLTQILFPKYFPVQFPDPEKAMKVARGEARAILSRKNKLFNYKVRRQRDISRRINRGLIARNNRG